MTGVPTDEINDPELGMTEDEVWKALEELHGEGKVDHVPSIGEVDSPHFMLTEEGSEYTEELLQKNDAAVLFVLQLALAEVDRPGDRGEVIEAVTKCASILRDEAGVNLFRVAKRNPESTPLLQVENITEEHLEAFDP